MTDSVHSDGKKGASRRDFMRLAGAMGALAAAGVGGNALAGSKHHHHHGQHSDLLADLSKCVATGEACIAHCLVLLGEGDSDMAKCGSSVSAMTPVCRATAMLANLDDTHLKPMAKVCLDVCDACKSECDKHRDKHQSCDDCYQACDKVVESLKAFLAA